MRQIIRIKKPDDPRIEPFRDVRDRDLRGRDGFIAEGAVVLDQLAMSNRFQAVSFLILESRFANLEKRLADFPADVPVYVASGDVFDAIAGFPVHRGVLAFGRSMPELLGVDGLDETLADIKRRRGLVLVASGLSNHDNMGALFRNGAAFGVGAVLLDPQACDPLYRKSIRVSVGTVLTVPFFRLESAEAIHRRLSAAGFECYALSPSGNRLLHEVEKQGPSALLVGTEGEGLPAELLARIQTLRITMAPGLDSLNVATSAAIALHHFFSRPVPEALQGPPQR